VTGRAETAAPTGLRLAPFRTVENQLLRCVPDDAPAVGVCRTRVSRLFRGGVGRYADSIIIAAGDWGTCEADLKLSRITVLKVAATQPRRRGAVTAPSPGRTCRRASEVGGRRNAEHADARRSRKARAPIRRGEFGLCDPRCPIACPAHRCAWRVSSTRIRTRRDTARVRGASDFPACGAAAAADLARPSIGCTRTEASRGTEIAAYAK
jgi:hypothetical protein